MQCPGCDQPVSFSVFARGLVNAEGELHRCSAYQGDTGKAYVAPPKPEAAQVEGKKQKQQEAKA